MPISSAGLTGAIIGGLSSVGFTGTGMPKLAQGIANGLFNWIRSLQVITVDAGTLGAGTGILPWFVPTPLITSNMLAAYAAVGHIGSMAPREATGLGTGLGIGFAQGVMQTTHPTVGVGTGVAKVVGGPALPFLLTGFSGVDIKGTAAVQKASAISIALTNVLAVFTLPIPIVGAPTPAGSSGVGQGRIL